ncbi:hypothetical protein HT031_005113 [Scenedesmus sp. PABB004]|nr:hypothetical protein HT031_005113 [Scenedesmus sp. PABB004]
MAALVLLAFVGVASGRTLLQGDLCADIPACEAGRCALKSISGDSKLICTKCITGYKYTADRLQCVCPPGTAELNTTTADGFVLSCEPCGKGSWCPGGSRSAAAASDARGPRNACGANTDTKSARARSATACFAVAGYFLSDASATGVTAAQCGSSTYTTGLNRQRACTPCPSGFAEDGTDGLTAAGRTTSAAVCKVPPGKFVSTNEVRDCAEGTYRANYTAASAAAACKACPRGVTTWRKAATSIEECTKLLPGFTFGSNKAAGTKAYPGLEGVSAQNGQPLYYAAGDATQCPYGTYFTGGAIATTTASPDCTPCPSGFTTQRLGATSSVECMAPPGYFSNNVALAKCPSGTFREDWAPAVSTNAAKDGADVCTACGAGIAAELREVDEHPTAAAGSKVASSAECCYITAGQGMLPDLSVPNKLAFKAVDCPLNFFGVNATHYGLASLPCTPCGRNLVTNTTKSTSRAACYNMAGYGYTGGGVASPCPVGSYSPTGAMRDCVACPTGRTTLDNSTAQGTIADCVVEPGYGIYTAGATDPFAAPAGLAGLTAEAKASLAVAECIKGAYGVGGAVDSLCTKCTTGATTNTIGATAPGDCSACTNGYGGFPICTACPYSTYSVGDSTGACTACASTSFSYVDGTGAVAQVSSDGITFYRGAASPAMCVPRRALLSPDAGTIYSANTKTDPIFTSTYGGLTTTGVASLADCYATCANPNTGCCMVQYNQATKTCYRAAPGAPVGTGTADGVLTVSFKLPPAGNVAARLAPAPSGARRLLAASAEPSGIVRAQMASSGLYARCATTAWTFSGAAKITGTGAFLPAMPGSKLDGTDYSWAACRDLCEQQAACWGFLWAAKAGAQGACYLRGGIDAPGYVSAFVNPDPDTVGLAAFNWS